MRYLFFIVLFSLSLTVMPLSAQAPSPSSSIPAASPASPAPGSAISSPSPSSAPEDPFLTPPPEAKQSQGVPVVVMGVRLFTITRPFAPYSIEARAALTQKRISRMLKTPRIRVEDIQVVDHMGDIFFMFNSTAILVVTKEDARERGMPQEALVKEYKSRIGNLILTYQKETDGKMLARHIGLALVLTILLLLLIIVAFSKFYRFARLRLQAMVGTTIKDFKIYNYTLLSGQRIADILTFIIRFILGLFKLVLLFFYFTLVFGLFIWTRDLTQKLTIYLGQYITLAFSTLLSYLPNLLLIIITMIGARYILSFTGSFFNELEKEAGRIPWFHQDWAQPSSSIVKFILIAFAGVIIVPLLPGYNSPAFKGVSLFFGILGALGSTAIVANLLSGVIIIYMNAFRVGDRVKIGETTGDIMEKGLLVTRIRTIKNVDVTIPNSNVLGAHIINYSTEAGEKGLILHTTVTIGYDAPWRTVHKLLIDAALATKHIEPEPAPFILQTALNDFYVAYELNAYTRQANQMHNIYGELHGSIQDKFNEGGVEILSPHYRSLRDGNTVGIPDSYLPPDYETPSFRVKSITEDEKKKPE
jgi:small-conductance mechanosensitive channel